MFREEPVSVHSQDMASGYAAVEWLLSHPCHIYYPPENFSSKQLDTSQGKDEQDQLSKCVPGRLFLVDFNRSDIHSTLFSACSPLSCYVSIKILCFLRHGIHMSVCFYNTCCNRHRHYSPEVFLRTKSFQPRDSASINGDD